MSYRENDKTWGDYLFQIAGWFLGGLFVLAIIAFVIMITGMIHEAKEKYEFAVSCKGEKYEALVISLGIPTDKETFEDGITVMCWKRYHESQMVMAGKVPVQQPAYHTGWKAVVKDGICISMEELK